MQVDIHCDGSCYNREGCNTMGMGIAIFNHEDSPIYVRGFTGGLGTNNIAEYIAVIEGLNTLQYLISTGIPITKAVIRSDSKIVINQINRDYLCEDKIMKRLLFVVYKRSNYILNLCKERISIEFKWVPRDHPRQVVVDGISKEANPYFRKQHVKHITPLEKINDDYNKYLEEYE